MHAPEGSAKRKARRSEPIELDLDRYELRRGGRRIALEHIPMELLILLVERQGALVTRDEIAERLWGRNPYLDPQANINTAIGKIRIALRDDPDEPRFVETVVTKGYRFAAPVRVAGRGLAPPLAEGPELLLIPSSRGADRRPVSTDNSPSPLSRAVGSTAIAAPQPVLVPMPQQRRLESPAPEPRSRGLNRWIWLAVLAVVVLAAGIEWLRHRPVPRPAAFVQITHDGSAKAVKLGNIPAPLVSDGSRVYFALLGGGGRFYVGQVAAAGGKSSILSSPLFSPRPLAMAPDQSAILLASPIDSLDAPLWVQPLPGGSPHRLADVVGSSASWSPNGKWLVYARRGTLYLAHADGTNPKILVSLPAASGQRIYWPRWAPGGRRVRFSVHDPKTSSDSIWEVNARGTKPYAVLPGWNRPSGECCGSWTADGNYLVFAAARAGREDIWAIREKRRFFRTKAQPVPLTVGPLNFWAALPSPDGKKIFVIGAENRGELVRYEPEAGEFVAYLSGISASGVDFSKDGRWVAYVSYPSQTLWRMKADGSDPLQLTFPPLHVSLPRWPPKGNEIAFYGSVPGSGDNLYLVSANGGTPEKLLPGLHNDLDPGWSPDGSSLIYERAPWEARGARRNTVINILNLKTRQISALPGSTGLVSPRWSPDGRFVVAMPADSSGLMLFSFATRQWTEILRLHIGYPNWSHDGKYIYFDRFDSPPGIERLRVSDGKVEQVVNVAKRDRFWTLTTWTAPAPDGSPMLLRDVSLQEIYAMDWSPR